MTPKTSFTYKMTPAQQSALKEILISGNYRPVQVPYAQVAVKAPDFNVTLFESGKCLIQGKGAEEFVLFIMEPMVMGQAVHGYEDTIDPDGVQPHMGIDESGKGDFFGPIVIVSAYVDPELAVTMRKMGVKDSKSITSDQKAMGMGGELRKILGNRFGVVKIGPVAYNRLYAKMRNVNTLLGWAHARAIENLLENVPDCPRAISDQFGKKEQVEKALMKKGQQIELIQMHKAESDLAVAAASVIARDLFLRSLKQMQEEFGIEFLKGASAQVRERAVELVRQKGPEILLQTAKCHFKTTDQVLEAAGASRKALGPEGQIVSKPYSRPLRGASPKPDA
jgi:ribonuclease HIII